MKMIILVFKKSATFNLVFGMILLGACASSKPPTQELARTEAAISQAEQVGARDYAPLEIREARQKLQRAQKLVAEERYSQAQRLANRAQVDAELAEAKALSEKAQNAVQQLRESIRLLKEEIERNQQNR